MKMIVHGTSYVGALGEYQSVTNEEHKAYVKEIVPYICDRVSVIVGASRERPEEVVELVENIKVCGGHAAMVLPPFYCHPSQDETVAHYKYIMDHVDFPVVAYNNTGSARIEIEQDTFKDCLKQTNDCKEVHLKRRN